MFFRSMLKVLNSSNDYITDGRFDKIDQNLVQYFRVEYGKDWKIALENHLYKDNIKNDKKAA